MRPFTPSLCALCEARALSRTGRQPWLSQQRTATTAQTRRPTRMALSPNVSRTSPTVKPAGRPTQRRANGPFGGMNVTEAKVPEKHKWTMKTDRKRGSRSGLQQDQRTEAPKRASSGSFKALKMQRALSAVPYERRTTIRESIADTVSFSDFGLLPVIEESISSQALRGLKDIPPTPIQRLAIPALLGSHRGKTKKRQPSETDTKAGMQEFLLAAETGSGKTLAYLLPVVDAIKRAEAAEKARLELEADQNVKRRQRNVFELQPPPLSNQPDPTTGRPRAIILVPSAELVEQVGALAKSLSHTVKFRAALLSAKFSGEVIRNRLFSPAGVDVVISTPHLLSSIVESNPDILSNTKHLIVDEADSLFDRSFAPITGSILDRARPSLDQLILCSATIPRSLDTFLQKRFPDMTRLTTPKLHSIPRRVRLSVIDVSTNDRFKKSKKLACASTIYDINKSGADGDDHSTSNAMKYVIVFVNERETTEDLASYLRSKGVSATALSRDSSERDMRATLSAFTAQAPEEVKKCDATKTPGDGSMTASNVAVLVTTDLASRGIDTLNVKNVILYDVPHTSIDFIHRLGRMGRMGQRGGRGFVIVGKDDRRDVVSEIREGMFAGRALI